VGDYIEHAHIHDYSVDRIQSLTALFTKLVAEAAA
jgi:hypothetical protein